MDHFAKLIAGLVLSCAGAAHAGYAQLSPPSGFGGSAGNWTYAPSANDVRYGPIAHSPNALRVPVPGTTVTMPASYRFAANAPKIAAAALFAHPAVRTAVGIASWLGIASIVWDAAQSKWVKILNTDGYEWAFGNPEITGWHATQGAACEALIAYFRSVNPSPSVAISGYVSGDKCIRVTTSISGGGSTAYDLISRSATGATTRPLTKEEFERELAPDVFTPGAPSTMPPTVPFELPKPTPLPVQQPIINPLPTENPQPRPLFVPTGNPVPNPQYDPNAPPGPNNQPYIQPGIRVVPSPTTQEPWRVDIQPVNRPQDVATPNPNPDAEPGTDPTDKPKPEEQQSLCEKHPDIVACAKLGEPGQATPVPNETKTLTIAPENGFGPSDASCPAPRTVEVAGLTLSMPFDLLCDFATGLKPVIVGLAWLTAAFTFMGIGRRS